MKYPNIDIMQTGLNLKQFITESGYNVRQIQEYLHLSCPQPIYRWFNGKMLPSLDNLYALSKLLCLPMEKLLVEQRQINLNMLSVELCINNHINQRYTTYYKELGKIA